MMRVDYIRVPGKEWVPDPANRFDTLDMRDPLMRVVRRAITAVWDDFSQPFVLPQGSAQRQAITPLPQEALREAIVNAVMHRSYRDQSPVQIIRYSNRLEIRNAGYSLKNEESWNEPRSDNRNPKIAATLHETLFAETKGSGMRVMRDAMEKVGLTPPYFESDRSKNSFVTIFLLHHFLSETDWQWLASFKEFALSDEESRALIWVRESGGTKGAINNAVYRNLNGTEAIEASTHLRRLRDCNILEIKGRGSQAYFVPGPIFKAVHEKWESGILAPPGESLGRAIGESLPPIAPPNKTQGFSIASDLLPFVGLSRAELIQQIPEELQISLQELGERPSNETLRAFLLRICALRPYRNAEIALLLGRPSSKLTERHLSPLVRAGKLARSYPDKPSHPHQAYRTISSKEK